MGVVQIWLAITGLPLLVYLWLALMPRGRVATVSLVLLGGLTCLAWGAFVIDIHGFSGHSTTRGVYTLLALTGVSTAVILGASLRLLRVRLPQSWPGWVWPLCVVATLFAVAWPLMRVING